jgi:ACT domain
VAPKVYEDIKLLLCAGRSDAQSASRIFLGLTRCLVAHPKFLSVTLTESEAPSILVQKDMISNFGSEDVLLGTTGDSLTPIVLDLRQLPLESTGIVCGVAGKLTGGTKEDLEDSPVNMTYLSTARAGSVMVEEDSLQKAIAALSAN